MTFPYALTGGLCARLAGPIRGLGPDHLLRQVAADLRGSLARPWAWLGGLALNLALSLAYLVVAPLTGQSDRDWAVLVGSYFASFILADVTTTNVLGADAGRVRHHLASGTGLGRVLMVKNGALLLVVGVPLLLVTAVLTLRTESASALGLTLGGVLFPILTWLGIGNLVSVALPVRALAWRTRWAQRHDLPATLRWVVALALPYGLCFGL
ncbi:MAG: hypothetical protein JWP61_198, partial [Friedmanniella sp.]|nr:hypothetical protein [Friedmanniella sp.]